MRALNAWIEDRRIGLFTESPQSDGTSIYSFEYTEPTDKDIVSLTMVPIEGELRFESRIFPPPFDMILPEGDRRTRLEDARKVLRADSFSLLSYVGANPVNRVRFIPTDETPREEPPPIPTPKEIEGTENGRELFRQILEATDLRQGVAGVQPKVLGTSSPQKLSADLRQFRGSTHLLKGSANRYPYLAANERTCLKVFATAGISVPKTTLSADGELLLVERFDLKEDKRLVGFEEAAALLGETSATKFDRDYGTMIEVLCEFISPTQHAHARSTLIKCILLNHLLGNGDAHLKNFGVLYEDSASVTLAPAYDCVSTLPYIANDVPALNLSFEWYSKAWWPRIKIEEFSIQYGWLTRNELSDHIEECCDAVMEGKRELDHLGKEMPGFRDLAGEIAALWASRVKQFSSDESILEKRKWSKAARD